jgi:hypothetical protein
VLEWKRDEEELSTGQHILLKQLAATPGFTVIVVYGHSANTFTHIGNFFRMNRDGSITHSGVGVEEFKKKYKAWFDAQ